MITSTSPASATSRRPQGQVIMEKTTQPDTSCSSQRPRSAPSGRSQSGQAAPLNRGAKANGMRAAVVTVMVGLLRLGSAADLLGVLISCPGPCKPFFAGARSFFRPARSGGSRPRCGRNHSGSPRPEGRWPGPPHPGG